MSLKDDIHVLNAVFEAVDSIESNAENGVQGDHDSDIIDATRRSGHIGFECHYQVKTDKQYFSLTEEKKASIKCFILNKNNHYDMSSEQ